MDLFSLNSQILSIEMLSHPFGINLASCHRFLVAPHAALAFLSSKSGHAASPSPVQATAVTGTDQTVSVECTLLIMLTTLACSLPSCDMQSVATLTHFSPRRRPGCVTCCLAIVTRRSSAGCAPRPLRRVGRVRAAAKAVYLTLVASGVAAPSLQPCFASHKCWVGSM